MLQLKEYQTRALEALKEYFIACKTIGNADSAFYETTRKWIGQGIPYNPVKQLQGLPYVCIRIPTGGGKTLVACHAVGITQKELTGMEFNIILWLVPSNTIKDQTIKALRNRMHHYRQAVESSLGNIEVMDIGQALYLKQSVLLGQNVIIVSTMQAFRVEETEGRKVYEQSGELEHHFQNLPPAKADDLECYAGTKKPIPSLANVLKMHRPIVVVDEAHNARTGLSFDTLARFAPSCIIEFTATPDTEKNPSNVLYRVSAAELKAENMIKIPIRLETRFDWKDLLTDAFMMRAKLEEIAKGEQRKTGEYIRPILLLQAQRKNQNQETLTFDYLEASLINDFGIPKEQIAVETGDRRDLEDIELEKPDCPIRFVITVDALREGWDCPFAYVLYTVAENYSSRVVEQILGRILRLPKASRKSDEQLNTSFAYASSPNWPEVAKSLTDALIGNGFNRLEAKDLITYNPQKTGELFQANNEPAMPLWASGVHTTVAVVQVPNIGELSEESKQFIHLDEEAKTITFKLDVNEGIRDKLKKESKDHAFRTAVDEAYNKCYFRKLSERNKLRKGYKFAIPMLAIQSGNFFEQFEKTHLLEYQWSILEYNSKLSEADYSSKRPEARIGLLDVDKEGDLSIEFLSKLSDDAKLWEDKADWTESELVTWLDKNISHSDIPSSETTVFILQAVKDLIENRAIHLHDLVLDKFRLRKAIEAKIEYYRQAAQKKAYQTFLFGDNSPIKVSIDKCFTFDPEAYPASSFYKNPYQWKKHYYDEVADMNTEEAECAIFIDQCEEVECWIRNIERRDSTSFWLQTSTDKFYPDFICKLKDGRFLVVEYKSEDRWSNEDSEEKRQLGEIWEKLSNGRCLFVMPKGKDLEAIKAKVIIGG